MSEEGAAGRGERLSGLRSATGLAAASRAAIRTKVLMGRTMCGAEASAVRTVVTSAITAGRTASAARIPGATIASSSSLVLVCVFDN